jgi:hypothetical protein
LRLVFVLILVVVFVLILVVVFVLIASARGRT